ncbi:alpha/beta hydrolase [Burkholderiaceae bacterium UC74_6]
MTLRRNFLASALSSAVAPLLLPASFDALAAPALPDATGPYQLPNTFVHPLPDPVTGRAYEVWVDLPTGAKPQDGPLPAVFVTDAPYAFPLVRSLRNRVGQAGHNIADFVLVGLAGPASESAVAMRSRDYTPTNPLARADKPKNLYGASQYGEGARYLRYVAELAVPAISARYNIDAKRRVILGHSYGALFAAQALLERPDLFSHHILGSPSLWFDQHAILEREAAYARAHRDLDARIFQYVGEFEAVRPGERYNKENDLVADMWRFQKTLQRRGYRSLKIESHVLAGNDHLTVAPAGATLGLLWALPGRGPYSG